MYVISLKENKHYKIKNNRSQGTYTLIYYSVTDDNNRNVPVSVDKRKNEMIIIIHCLNCWTISDIQEASLAIICLGISSADVSILTVSTVHWKKKNKNAQAKSKMKQEKMLKYIYIGCIGIVSIFILFLNFNF